MSPAPTRVDPTCLDDHFRRCAHARGPMHRLRCTVQAMDGLMAPRLLTTLLLSLLLIAGLLWLA